MSAQARRSEWRAHAKPLHVTSKPHVTAVNLKRKHTTLSLGGGPVQNPGSPRWFSAGWDSGLPHSVVSPELDLGIALECEVLPRGTQALDGRALPPHPPPGPSGSPSPTCHAVRNATRLLACPPVGLLPVASSKTRALGGVHATLTVQPRFSSAQDDCLLLRALENRAFICCSGSGDIHLFLW